MSKESFLSESYNDDELNEMLFYTPKIVQCLDDKIIIDEIYVKYPRLKDANLNKEEKEERKIFLMFLQEKKLINEILKKYNINIIDLIKIFYRHFSYIFNTIAYSNKIRAIITQNGYSTEKK